MIMEEWKALAYAQHTRLEGYSQVGLVLLKKTFCNILVVYVYMYIANYSCSLHLKFVVSWGMMGIKKIIGQHA